MEVCMARILTLFLMIAIALAARDPLPTPLIRTADPAMARTGDVVTVTGENLEKDLVLEVYLTDRTQNTKVSILEQSRTSIKFKVPPVKPGKYWLMVLANPTDPVLIEEPCRITVEDGTSPSGFAQ